MSQRWACLLGHPVAHSLSPVMHNAAFTALGIDAVYDARDVAPGDLLAAIEELREPACLGANVTAPHKEAVLTLLDGVSEEVRVLGAVNTIINRDGHLAGDNTDARGLGRWMNDVGIVVAGRPALVLGAGGAARASVRALTRLGAPRVHVLNRSTERAARLVDDLQPFVDGVALSWGELEDAAQATDEPYGVVVNATSMGHQGTAPNVHASCYSPGSTAVELAYSPPETEFMRAARSAGARAENGLGMLLHQAILAFERWTGQTPPIEVLQRALEQRDSV